ANLVFYVSGDKYAGDAQFTIQVDGSTVGGVNTVSASHAAHQSEAFLVSVPLSAGSHRLGITFLNDAWGGDPSHDRNVYLDKVSVFGDTAIGSSLTAFLNGPISFLTSVDATGHLITPTGVISTLGDISTRLKVGTGAEVAIAGFIIEGTAPKKVVVR